MTETLGNPSNLHDPPPLAVGAIAALVTQWSSAQSATNRKVVRLPTALMRPIASDDVSTLLARIAGIVPFNLDIGAIRFGERLNRAPAAT